MHHDGEDHLMGNVRKNAHLMGNVRKNAHLMGKDGNII